MGLSGLLPARWARRGSDAAPCPDAPRRAQPKRTPTQWSEHVAEVYPMLYLGSLSAAHSLTLLRELGVRSVVNCTTMRPRFPENFAYFNCPLDDTADARIDAYFDDASEWARCAAPLPLPRPLCPAHARCAARSARPGGTLVHCVAGVSRSCAMALALMMRVHGLTLLDAWTRVKAARPVVRPNPSFLVQLRGYEARVHGRCSVDVRPPRKKRSKRAALVPAAAPR